MRPIGRRSRPPHGCATIRSTFRRCISAAGRTRCWTGRFASYTAFMDGEALRSVSWSDRGCTCRGGATSAASISARRQSRASTPSSSRSSMRICAASASRRTGRGCSTSERKRGGTFPTWPQAQPIPMLSWLRAVWQRPRPPTARSAPRRIARLRPSRSRSLAAGARDRRRARPAAGLPEPRRDRRSRRRRGLHRPGVEGARSISWAMSRPRSHVEADQPTHDLSCTLSLVSPDGRAMTLASGFLRVTDSAAPGPRRVPLGAVCCTVPAGTALRLSIQGAAWPAFMINPGVKAPTPDTRLMDCAITTCGSGTAAPTPHAFCCRSSDTAAQAPRRHHQRSSLNRGLAPRDPCPTR